MAFDLNKNDGSDKGSSPKTQTSSKFDLSKGDAAGVMAAEKHTSSKTWIIGLMGILIIGAGIWYYSSASGTAVVAGAKDQTVVTDTLTAAQPTEQPPSVTAVVENAADSRQTVSENNPSETQRAPKTPVAENVVSVPSKIVSERKSARSANLNNQIPVTFSRGSSSVRQINPTLVKRIISYLNNHPAASINVNGYASSDGSLVINQSISQARADAFKTYLVSRNIGQSRVIAVGKGIENPIASNNTNAGRKKNRRVEIILP